MGDKIGITWTNVELTALLEDEDSCVYFEKVEKHVGLQPFHLIDLNFALREILDVNLNFFDPELNGLVLAYRNLKLLTPYGDTDDYGCVHVDIEADFYIFRPQVGRSLKGFVSKKKSNYVCILVHKTYSASVPNIQGEEDENEDWPGCKVKVGQQVRFTPTEINYNARIPYIRGEFHEEEYLNGCQLFDDQIAAQFESEYAGITRNSFSEDTQDVKRKFIKSENKRILFNSDSEVEVDPDSESEQKPSAEKLKTNKIGLIKTPRKRKKESTSESEAELTQKSEIEQKIKTKKYKLSNNLDNSDLEAPHDQPSQSNKKSFIESDKTPDSGVESEAYENNVKKHKKKSKKDKVDSETEDESKYKGLISLTNQMSPFDSEEKERDEGKLKKSKKRKKRVSECADTEDEKNHKATIRKEMFEHASNTASELESSHWKTKSEEKERDEGKLKKLKKRKERDSECVDTEDEKNHKATIRKELLKHASNTASESDSSHWKTKSEEEEKDEVKLKKLKKRKERDSECVDTEDEKNHKATIRKELLVSSTASESVSSHRKTKKRKRSFAESDICADTEDTEDERNHKLSLKKGEFEVSQTSPKKQKTKSNEDEGTETEDEKKYKKNLLKSLTQTSALEKSSRAEFKIPDIMPKKRKKKHSDDDEFDTEDEKNYKKSLRQYISQIEPLDDLINSQPSESLFSSTSQDDLLMNTDDERKHKASLKPLVQSLQNSNIDDAELAVPKKKKLKKKHRSSSDNTLTSNFIEASSD